MSESKRTILIKQLRLMLGDQMTDIELDIEHYELAVTLSLERYRQRSDGSTQERDIFLNLQSDTTTYKLPDNVQTIWRVHRRGIGSQVGGGGGSNFDPASAMSTNMFMYNGGQAGGVATWEAYSQFKETLSRVFASEINFNWNYDDKELTIIRMPRGNETVMITAFVAKDDSTIMSNYQSGPWIRDYSLAQCKFFLGEARSKYASGFAGPQGSIMLNGDQMKQEALGEMERLESEIQNFVTSNRSSPFIIG